MNYGVIDIGSNSVRLLFCGKKQVVNTQLAEKANRGGTLLAAAMERTANAVFDFAEYVKEHGGTVAAFATEAVRSAANGEEFLKILADRGIGCDVLSPDREAQAGFCGAYYGEGIKAVLDVGGASSELIVGDNGGIIYSHSLPLGSVRVKDIGLLPPELNISVAQRVKEYGKVPAFSELICIGGTSSSVLAVRDKVEPYDSKKIHLKKLYFNEVEEVVKYIYSVPTEDRKKIAGLHPKKVEVVPAGGVLISEIMKYLGVDCMTVSESDNLEGYLASLT